MKKMEYTVTGAIILILYLLCLCTGKIPPGFGALQLWIKL